MLADRYKDLMALRREGLRRYRANEFSTVSGPPAKVHFPAFFSQNSGRGRTIVSDRPPIWHYAENAISGANISVLEVGPGAGRLAQHLQQRFPGAIRSYYGLERDASFSGPYIPLQSIDDAPNAIDLVIASEVAEHMSADEWHKLLQGMSAKMSPSASLIMSVPNPTSPGGIARDFTHTQNYPWYDLYALMRLHFENVDIHRSLYVWSVQRLVTLVPRILLCPIMELDWCDTLICTASQPSR